MRTLFLLLITVSVVGCSTPNYRGGKGGIPFHDNPDVKLVEGIIQLKYFAVEDALHNGANINALHDLSKSIPRFWINVRDKKRKYTPLGALLRTSRSSQANRRVYEEKQYIDILNLLFQYGLDPNSRLGLSGPDEMTMNFFSDYGYLRGPSATVGIPLLYNKGLEINTNLFETPSFNLTELRILRNKQPEFWDEINTKFSNVLTERVDHLIRRQYE